jgi:hypothetical protein
VLVAPREDSVLESPARRAFPFRLGGDLLPRPRCERLGVLIGDVNDGMAIATVDGRARTARTFPICARDVLPPVAKVVEAYRPGRLPEDQRPRDEQLRVCVRVVGRIERAFCDRDVTGLTHEPTELGRRHRTLVYPKRLDLDATHRSFLRVEAFISHVIGAARDEDHPSRGCSTR